jgi:hypothetical protein
VEVQGAEAIRVHLRELNHRVREHRAGAGAGVREEEVLDIQAPIAALEDVGR